MLRAIIFVLLPIMVMVGSLSIFTVQETELALMLRFKKIVGTDFGPGLHFKSPIHNVMTFDKRIQTLDSPPEQFLTVEKKNLIVDSFIKWRITDIVTYYKAVSGNQQRARDRLGEIIADGLRSEFGKRTIKEVVSGDRVKIMGIITKEANLNVPKLLGIDIVDVRIKRIELPAEVSNSVYRRMEAERERVAKKWRSQGEADAVRIMANADRERIEVFSQAERDSEQIRGEGEAISADTYAKAYNQNQEFYTLYRSLNAYKTAFNSRDDILIIQPDSDFFNYFKNLNGKKGFYPISVTKQGLTPAPTTPEVPKTSLPVTVPKVPATVINNELD
ncbi:MAG: protease modulator HflC [Candidatus Marithrix sp.]|nr:protease modulator HflC [Candidatus Marithrix sp.]